MSENTAGLGRFKQIRGYSCLALLLAGAFLAVSSVATAAPDAASTTAKKPAWLTELSIGTKESYDDNVLLVADLAGAMQAQSSWITTISPRFGVNFIPLLDAQKTFKTLSLAYAPDFNFYHEASAENFNAHKLALSVKAAAGDFSFAFDNAFLYVDGNTVASIYTGNDKNRSAYATAVPRERRKQMQERPAVTLQYDIGPYFVRLTGSETYYDLMSNWSAASGYQNYVSRYDLNGGGDLGLKLNPALAITLGYRSGRQYQQAFTPAIGSTYQSTNAYRRFLFGLEGKPFSWLTAKLSVGPDYRTYNATAPVDDYHPIAYYGEGTFVAAVSSSQSLTFNYKQWRWVSSTGKVPYIDSTFALGYHWNVNKQLGLDLGAKYLDSNYTIGSAAKSANSSLRNDAQYTVSAGVTYAFSPRLSASVTYAHDSGRNREDLPASLASTAAYREFDHQLISVGVQYKY